MSECEGSGGGGEVSEVVTSSPKISLCYFINEQKREKNRQKLSHPLKGSKMPI